MIRFEFLRIRNVFLLVILVCSLMPPKVYSMVDTPEQSTTDCSGVCLLTTDTIVPYDCKELLSGSVLKTPQVMKRLVDCLEDETSAGSGESVSGS
jgi:hypothetical protein